MSDKGAGKRIIPFVMCGGSGTRLWPVSRDSHPKQFIALFGERSSFQRTLALLSDPEVFDRPVVLTNAEYRFKVLEQLQAIGIEADIVLEPARRDSGPAVAVAAELGLARDPGAVVGVFAADHRIGDDARFVATCREAGRVAARGLIVTIGIPPTHPATEYGYIRPGPEIGDGARAVGSFVEKPDAARAAEFQAAGYLWNSGNFIFSAATMRDELRVHAPGIAAPVAEAVAGMSSDLAFEILDARAFGRAEKVSIDYAVLERTKKAAVVAGGFPWSDIGGWSAVWDLSAKDERGNAIAGRGYVLDGANNLVRSEGTVVAVMGLDDVAVVATRDAVLVTPKDKAQNVKQVVARLQAGGEPEATEHPEVQRPWGSYISIDSGNRYQVKRITVKPGGSLSLQKHFHRAEHWIVVRGTAEVVRNEETILVHENESIYLPIGSVHRLTNPGKIVLELIEVQVGSYLGEDDIVRLEDIYRRV